MIGYGRVKPIRPAFEHDCRTKTINQRYGIATKSEREKPMNTPSRRTLLANAPAVAVAALAGGAVTKALSAEPDPVFAAIEAHKAAMAANTAVFNTEDEDAVDDALEAVLTCQPTTTAGIIALLEHMSAPSKDGTVLAFAFGADEDSPIYQAAADLPAMIAETLRSL